MRASLRQAKKRHHKTVKHSVARAESTDLDLLIEETMSVPVWIFTAKALEKVLGDDIADELGRKYLRFGDYHWRLYYSPKFNLYREHVNYVLEYFSEKTGTLLDVGCGEGLILERLNQETELRCHGIDISPLAITLAHQHGVENCEVAEIFDLDKTFDHIFAGDVLEHTMKPEIILKKMYELLNPGGDILISVPIQKEKHIGDRHLFTLASALQLTSNIFGLARYEVKHSWFKIYFVSRKQKIYEAFGGETHDHTLRWKNPLDSEEEIQDFILIN